MLVVYRELMHEAANKQMDKQSTYLSPLRILSESRPINKVAESLLFNEIKNIWSYHFLQFYYWPSMRLPFLPRGTLLLPKICNLAVRKEEQLRSKLI